MIKYDFQERKAVFQITLVQENCSIVQTIFTIGSFTIQYEQSVILLIHLPSSYLCKVALLEPKEPSASQLQFRFRICCISFYTDMMMIYKIDK